MTRPITIALRARDVQIIPEWAGKSLAVHKPVAIDVAGGHPVFREVPGRWCITHIHTGLSAGVFTGSLDHAKAFASQWDGAFAAVTTSELPARLRQDYLAALAVASRTSSIRESEPMTDDPVNHPAHYTAGPIEAIDVIHQAVSFAPQPWPGYCLGQTLKYLLRLWHKGHPLEDAPQSPMVSRSTDSKP